MAKPLAGNRVWVSRPAAQATGFAAALEAVGATPLLAPAIEISPLQGESEAWRRAKSLAMDLDHYQHIIFVSSNAVAEGMSLVDSVWPQLPLGISWYGVGRATVAALKDWQVEAEQGSGEAMNSEALLQHPALAELAGQRVLIVRGQGGRPWLGQQMEDRGARVDYLEVYRRLCPQRIAPALVTALAAAELDFITAASGETVENICQLIDDRDQGALLAVPIVVPGERVAQIARQQGFNQPLVARNASPEAMIAAMVARSSQ